MSKSAVVTGITGQDGAYLAKQLLDLGYQVHGTYRRTSSINFWRIEEIGIKQHPNLHLIEYDLTDTGGSIRLIEQCEPDEVYNLAAQSFVDVSFKQPYATAQISALGVLNLLEAIRIVNKSTRFYQASTSELFGQVKEVPQNENTPFYPRSPYGVAKLYAHWITRNYHESYDIYACSGILFNHESPLRGTEFVTRKITQSVARIIAGKQDFIELGNLDAKRDWGYAPDYIEGMIAMLQQDEPDTFVLATGRTETVRQFAELAFSAVGITLDWQGRNENEIGIDASTGTTRIKINKHFWRPAEVNLLIGDPGHARDKLGWQAKTQLEEMCNMMVEADIEKTRRGFPF